MIGSGVTGSLYNEINNLEGSRDSDRGVFGTHRLSFPMAALSPYFLVAEDQISSLCASS
jgi:hypothetical protein